MFKTGQHVEITSPRLLEILAYRVKPIEAKMFGLVEGSYMSSNEFDEATGCGR